MVSNDELEEASNRLVDTKTLLFDAGEKELQAKEMLKRAQFNILVEYAEDPKRLGGNEPARNAKIAELTFLERATSDKAETERRAAQLKFDLAGMRYDCLKWQIRNNEVNKEEI
jgi:hypothetical protein